MRGPTRLLLVCTVGCQAHVEPGTGPTFGGDNTSTTTALGQFEASPVAVSDGLCTGELCVASAALVRPDGTWLVALGVEGVLVPSPQAVEGWPRFERPAIDLTLALDASSSVDSAAAERSAAVEIALDHLDRDDSAAIVAFAAEPVVLMSRRQGAEAATLGRQVLAPLERLGAIAAALDTAGGLLVTRDVCTAPPSALHAELFRCARMTDAIMDAGTASSVSHPCGPWWEWKGTEALEDTLDELQRLAALEEAGNDDLVPGIQALACAPGTDVAAALALATTLAPDGTGERASRVVAISDVDGGAAATEPILAAAEAFVGLTLIGLTENLDRVGAGALASAPGAHLIDAGDPALALHTWDARFDLLVSPRAWDLRVTSRTDGWEVVEVVGSVDPGANTVFASEKHGALAAIVAPGPRPGGGAWLQVGWQHPAGAQAMAIPVRAPLPLLDTPLGKTDHLGALRVAARLHLVEARAEARETGDDGAVHDAITRIRDTATSLPEALRADFVRGLPAEAR